MGLDQLLKCLGFRLYPLSFFLYSPFYEFFIHKGGGGWLELKKKLFQSFLDSEYVLREIGLLCPELSSDPETRLGPSQSSSYLGLATIESVLPTLLRSPGLGPNSLLGLGPSSLLGLGP